jgi:hypothetical protein
MPFDLLIQGRCQVRPAGGGAEDENVRLHAIFKAFTSSARTFVDARLSPRWSPPRPLSPKIRIGNDPINRTPAEARGPEAAPPNA